MSLTIHYKLKNSSKKPFQTVSFEGSVISILDLKRAITAQERLFETETDHFDLRITNAQTDEAYSQDSYLIPKNTSVMVRPVRCRPADSLKLKLENNLVAVGGEGWTDVARAPVVIIPREPDTSGECEKIKAVMQQASHIYCKGANGKPGTQGNQLYLSRVPPPGYLCHRCGKTDHLIKFCPTNGDPAYDMKRVRKATGIPVDRLQAIQNVKTVESRTNGTIAVAAHRPTNSDRLSGNDHSRESEKIHEGKIGVGNMKLKCPLCRNLFKNPVTVPCCKQSFCNECIRQVLIAGTSLYPAETCPLCKATEVFPDQLKVNRGLQSCVTKLTSSTTPVLQQMNSSSELSPGANQATNKQTTQLNSTSRSGLSSRESSSRRLAGRLSHRSYSPSHFGRGERPIRPRYSDRSDQRSRSRDREREYNDYDQRKKRDSWYDQQREPSPYRIGYNSSDLSNAVSKNNFEGYPQGYSFGGMSVSASDMAGLGIGVQLLLARAAATNNNGSESGYLSPGYSSYSDQEYGSPYSQPIFTEQGISHQPWL